MLEDFEEQFFTEVKPAMENGTFRVISKMNCGLGSHKNIIDIENGKIIGDKNFRDRKHD